jgi:hypothetical protein
MYGASIPAASFSSHFFMYGASIPAVSFSSHFFMYGASIPAVSFSLHFFMYGASIPAVSFRSPFFMYTVSFRSPVFIPPGRAEARPAQLRSVRTRSAFKSHKFIRCCPFFSHPTMEVLESLLQIPYLFSAYLITPS